MDSLICGCCRCGDSGPDSVQGGISAEGKEGYQYWPEDNIKDLLQGLYKCIGIRITKGEDHLWG